MDFFIYDSTLADASEMAGRFARRAGSERYRTERAPEAVQGPTMLKATVPVLVLALLSGCATNPLTGRDQIVALPVIQVAYAEVGSALSAGARSIADFSSCAPACGSPEDRARFVGRVESIGARLDAEARDLAPDLFERIGAFRVEVNDGLGAATGSSAGGRIALGSGLVPLAPTDTEIGFLIAREMAHVIARHAEEDSGASLLLSVLGQVLLPGVNMIARLVVTTVGSQALKGSWAAAQQREADDIALALLARTGLPAFAVALDLQSRPMRAGLPDDSWGANYLESARYVAQVAVTQPFAEPAAALTAAGLPQGPLLAQNGTLPCPASPAAATDEAAPGLCAPGNRTPATKPGP